MIVQWLLWILFWDFTNQDFFSGKNLDDWGFCPLECVLHMFTMEIGWFTSCLPYGVPFIEDCAAETVDSLENPLGTCFGLPSKVLWRKCKSSHGWTICLRPTKPQMDWSFLVLKNKFGIKISTHSSGGGSIWQILRWTSITPSGITATRAWLKTGWFTKRFTNAMVL